MAMQGGIAMSDLIWLTEWRAAPDHVASSFTFELSKVGQLNQVPPRMVGNLRNVDEELAQRVADGLGIKLPPKGKAARDPVNMEPSPAVSIQKNIKDTLEGRCVGILFADGSDGEKIDEVVTVVTKAKGKAVLIAPKVGGAKLSDGSLRKADGQLDRLCLPRQATRAKEAFPSADLHWFESSGHFPAWDMPEETVAVILAATR